MRRLENAIKKCSSASDTVMRLQITLPQTLVSDDDGLYTGLKVHKRHRKIAVSLLNVLVCQARFLTLYFHREPGKSFY